MKKIVLVVLLAAFVAGFNSTAQNEGDGLTRKEKRELKKQKRRMDVVDFKHLIEENRDLKQDVRSLETYKDEATQMGRRIAQLEQELRQKENQINQLEQEAELKDDMDAIPEGRFFRVQLGAFKEYSLDISGLDNIHVENENGFSKYTIGNFDTYAEANEFRKEIVKMGIAKAWIVVYDNGIRIPMQEEYKQ